MVIICSHQKKYVTDNMFSPYYKNVTCYKHWKSQKKAKNQTCITKKKKKKIVLYNKVFSMVSKPCKQFKRIQTIAMAKTVRLVDYI